MLPRPKHGPRERSFWKMKAPSTQTWAEGAFIFENERSLDPNKSAIFCGNNAPSTNEFGEWALILCPPALRPKRLWTIRCQAAIYAMQSMKKPESVIIGMSHPPVLLKIVGRSQGRPPCKNERFVGPQWAEGAFIFGK